MKRIFLLGLLLAAPIEIAAQPATRADKLAAKMRVEYVKLTRNIKVPTIKAEELQPILEDTNLVLIDVRQPNEQAVSMLPHAITPVGFQEKFRKGIPAGKRIVVYCTIGYRSGKYAEQLAAQGIRAENLEGGVLAWSHAGGTFIARDAKGVPMQTFHVHVYDKEWNFLHPDYKPQW